MGPVLVEDKDMYTYRATVLKVVDGDTLHLYVDLGMDVVIKQSVRLLGIDCPEMSTADGKRAKAYVEALLQPGSVVTITTTKDKREKYGRYLAEVFLANGPSLGNLLLGVGLAREYGGGKR